MTSVLLLAAAAIIVIVAAAVAGAVFRPGRVVSGYKIEIPVGMSPQMPPTSVAAVAVGYLDGQTPQLAAPNLHAEPHILRVVAARAVDVRALEPAVPEARAEAAVERIVWVVLGKGDFLNLRDYAWSVRGDPNTTGTIVIDDATGSILGVYPHDLPGVPEPTPSLAPS